MSAATVADVDHDWTLMNTNADLFYRSYPKGQDSGKNLVFVAFCKTLSELVSIRGLICGSRADSAAIRLDPRPLESPRYRVLHSIHPAERVRRNAARLDAAPLA